MRTSQSVWFSAVCFVLNCFVVLPVAVRAEAPRVRETGQPSADARLAPAKTLDDHFPFVVPDDVATWHARSEMLRRRVLVATGLWPMPEKPPINAVIYGKSQREGFSVEKVYFESLPGHYVTGLLFRPSQPSGTASPGVLCPHGHGGRMQRFTDDEIESQIKLGGEHFRDSGRTPKLARCAQLARMGCVSFIFDMLGYADSIQIPQEVAHRHKDPRPEELLPNDSGWLLYSPEADARLQSVMGLQTWNAIRALDFLASLPDVDADRLAVTGGSGGGTQSILLGAIDDRIKASFPNGMVSTSMQGGCYCENCNFLRIDTGNVELAALFAPKPQAMTAADDWTRDMMSDGYPQLRWLYALLGNESDVYCRPMLNFKHNYNYVARATMYTWMNRHLRLGLDEPVVEQDFTPLTDLETAVWSDAHPLPGTVGMDHERAVGRWFDEQAREILDSTRPKDEESLRAYRTMVGGAWQIIFDQPIPNDASFLSTSDDKWNGLQLTRGLVSSPSRGNEIPLLVLRDPRRNPKTMVVWSAESGKDVAFDDAGEPSKFLVGMLERGAVLLLPDLMRQGEWGGTSDDTGPRLVAEDRDYSAFTYGYNRCLAAERCSDLLTVVAYAAELAKHAPQVQSVCLLATDQSEAWAAPAAALVGPMVARAAIVTNGFRFETVRSYRDDRFVPGAVKYGDLPSLLALRSPHSLMILGEPVIPGVVQDAFKAADASSNVRVASLPEIDEAALKWLVD